MPSPEGGRRILTIAFRSNSPNLILTVPKLILEERRNLPSYILSSTLVNFDICLIHLVRNGPATIIFAIAHPDRLDLDPDLLDLGTQRLIVQYSNMILAVNIIISSMLEVIAIYRPLVRRPRLTLRDNDHI